MELKFQNMNQAEIVNTGSNRTFMELKFHQRGEGMEAGSVLIVPLWN